MKVALCQINPTVGAFDYNKSIILESYKKAIENGVDLVVFPEMVIPGYLPQDLLWEEGFVADNLSVLNEIAEQSTIPVIIGYVRENKHNLYNSAAICMDGQIVYNYDKQLLPTYDVFDEARYFTPGKSHGIWNATIKDKSYKIGLEICEDLWDDDYDKHVTKELLDIGVDVIINISASPFHENRLQDRIDHIKEKVGNHQIPFIYCNLIGAQDEIIFDGQSVILNKNQDVIAVGNGFKEDIVICDINTARPVIDKDNSNLSEGLYRALCLGVKDYFRKTGHSKAIVSLSGGIDSALVACIAVDALGNDNVHVVGLPSKFSSDHSIIDAQQLAENLEIKFNVVEIQYIVNQVEKDLGSYFSGTKRNIAEENIQARVRGNLIMALSNKFGWMVLSTGNKTEMALGYCTLYGDMSGGLAVISDLSKTDVYSVSNWINKNAGYDRIPRNIITKDPSAELAPDQVDPFNYEIVSPIVDAIIEEKASVQSLVKKGYNKELVERLSTLIRINEFKRRQAAPGLRVSRKAFGVGRRIPIVNHYKGK